MEGFTVAVVLIVVCIFGIIGYAHKVRRGGGCCGTHEPPEKRIRIVDRKRNHYPYSVILTIDGMTCSNCARRVENTLNRMDGVWATVDLETKQATVLLKQLPNESALRQAIREIGYTVLSIQ